MSLSDLASLGSFVSGIAVLASLVFLYVQLRQLGAQISQAETNQRAMINEAYVTRVSDMLQWIGEPANSHLIARVIEGECSFDAEEITRLSMMFRWNIMNVLGVTQHHEAGLIDTAAFQQARLAFKQQWLAFPVYRVIWGRQAETVAPQMRKVIDDMISEVPLAPPSIDMVAAFADDLAKVLSDAGAAPSAASA